MGLRKVLDLLTIRNPKAHKKPPHGNKSPQASDSVSLLSGNICTCQE